MSLKSILFQCHAGHQQYAPYACEVRIWCEGCRRSVLCAPVPPTAEQIAEANREAAVVIHGKFREFEATWDRSRAGLTTHFAPDPKDDTERALAQALRTMGFTDRHIAALPHMDAQGLVSARAVMDVFRGPGPGIVILWGDYGRGKTQTAVAVARDRWLRAAPLRTRYTTGLALIRMIKDNFGTRVPESELLRRFHECAGLVIDDIHAALDNEPDRQAWARTQIQGIVDVRYATNKPLKTILICNADSSEVLTARIGAHILSRAQECGKVFRLNKTNYRAPSRIQKFSTLPYADDDSDI